MDIDKDPLKEQPSYLVPLTIIPFELLRSFRDRVLTIHNKKTAEHERNAPKTNAMGYYSVERHFSDYTADIGSFPEEWHIVDSPFRNNLEGFIAQEFGRHSLAGTFFDVLDVGCGRGDFLLDVFEALISQKGLKYDEKTVRKYLKLVGISLNDFRSVRGGLFSKEGQWHRKTTEED